jgi:hypothetical protein
VALDPPLGDVQCLDPRPLIGAMRRELAVPDTRDALIPPQERHAVMAGAWIQALGLTILTREHTWSRVAGTLAGDDLDAIGPRPMAATHSHDTRVGRALDARGATGLDRAYGPVINQAIRC